MSDPEQFQNLREFQLPENFRGRSHFIVQLWWIIEKTLIAWSPQFLYGWRSFIYRIFGAKIGRNVLIRPTARMTYPWKISIGDYSWIGESVVLYSLADITIGKNVVISQNSYLCTGSHDYQSLSFDIFSKPIRLADEVWIASDVFIAPGVSIGKGTVVGMRSTVLNNLPEAKLCFGNPAVVIKDRLGKSD